MNKQQHVGNVEIYVTFTRIQNSKIKLQEKKINKINNNRTAMIIFYVFEREKY